MISETIKVSDPSDNSPSYLDQVLVKMRFIPYPYLILSCHSHHNPGTIHSLTIHLLSSLDILV